MDSRNYFSARPSLPFRLQIFVGEDSAAASNPKAIHHYCALSPTTKPQASMKHCRLRTPSTGSSEHPQEQRAASCVIGTIYPGSSPSWPGNQARCPHPAVKPISRRPHNPTSGAATTSFPHKAFRHTYGYTLPSASRPQRNGRSPNYGKRHRTEKKTPRRAYATISSNAAPSFAEEPVKRFRCDKNSHLAHFSPIQPNRRLWHSRPSGPI